MLGHGRLWGWGERGGTGRIMELVHLGAAMGVGRVHELVERELECWTGDRHALVRGIYVHMHADSVLAVVEARTGAVVGAEESSRTKVGSK